MEGNVWVSQDMSMCVCSDCVCMCLYDYMRMIVCI